MSPQPLLSRRRLLVVLVPIGAIPVANGQVAAYPGWVIGIWGGDQVVATFHRHGGEIEYDCGAGLIDLPVQIEGDGSFVARGTHHPYHGGADTADEKPIVLAAYYHARLSGTAMELRVKINSDGGARTFRLEKNRKVKLLRCL